MPTVSVVIPNFNNTKFLGNAIQSALNQTYRSFEIIVVDDGSTDNCKEEIKKFGQQVRYIWQINQGLGSARNTGIRAAEGEYIGFLDADDEWLPEFLDKMVSQVTNSSNMAAVYCYAQGIDSEGCNLPQIFGGPVISPEKIYQTILRANFLIPSTILIRRSIVLSIGLFEQTNRMMHGCEDWDLWLRILRNNPQNTFEGVPECLVRYRLHNNSLSVNSEKMQVAVSEVIKKNYGLDDNSSQKWSKEKRRAYGGVYRYHLITSIRRPGNWQFGPLLLSKALHADPSLALDLSLFYDLALGAQPTGFRGTANQLNFMENAVNVKHLVKDLFNSTKESDIRYLKRKVFGTANFALGLVAYNTRQHSICRYYFIKALFFRPELVLESRVIINLFKSFLISSGYFQPG